MLLTIQTLQTFTYKDDQQEKYCDDEDDHDSYGDDGGCSVYSVCDCLKVAVSCETSLLGIGERSTWGDS